MIAIIDYGMGNLGSIRNMLSRIGVKSLITSDHNIIESADKLILPGIGAFDNAMTNLNKLNIIPTLNQIVLEKRLPILGICLGMQLITKRSEEGTLHGLGWIDAETVKFKFDSNSLKIPHMSWNNVKLNKESCLFKNMYEDPRFYFVHSYHVKCKNSMDVLTTTDYGIEFCSSIEKDNIFGVQFHPEKSHKFGMKLLKNFAELC